MSTPRPPAGPPWWFSWPLPVAVVTILLGPRPYPARPGWRPAGSGAPRCPAAYPAAARRGVHRHRRAGRAAGGRVIRPARLRAYGRIVVLGHNPYAMTPKQLRRPAIRSARPRPAPGRGSIPTMARWPAWSRPRRPNSAAGPQPDHLLAEALERAGVRPGDHRHRPGVARRPGPASPGAPALVAEPAADLGTGRVGALDTVAAACGLLGLMLVKPWRPGRGAAPRPVPGRGRAGRGGRRPEDHLRAVRPGPGLGRPQVTGRPVRRRVRGAGHPRALLPVVRPPGADRAHESPGRHRPTTCTGCSRTRSCARRWPRSIWSSSPSS